MVTIGIVARKSYDEDGTLSFLIREPNLRNTIIEFGGTPFLLLPQRDISNTIEILKMCDGIVLPGGDDWTDLDLIDISYAIENNLPILGICLGMQAMGTNGDDHFLYLLKDSTHKSTAEKVHKVQIKKESMLYRILKTEEIIVNSRHSYAISTPSFWKVVATSEDGVIEAIEKENHPFCIGVQWHPEDMMKDNCKEKLFSQFIYACKCRKKDYNNTCS